MPFVLWAIALILTLVGIDVIEVHSEESVEEFLGYLLVGFGMMFMALAGKASR